MHCIDFFSSRFKGDRCFMYGHTRNKFTEIKYFRIYIQRMPQLGVNADMKILERRISKMKPFVYHFF